MDRGRMIDHLQNTNAKYFDKFGSHRTSVRLMQPPGGTTTIQLGWDYTEPKPQPEKMKTPLQLKHISQMASNGISCCLNDQGITQSYPSRDNYGKTQKYPPPQVFEIPKTSNYRKTPTQKPAKPFNPGFGYEMTNTKPLLDIKDNAQMGDYYPHHLTYCYENSQIKPKANQIGNSTHKSYEQFLSEHILAKQKSNKALQYNVSQPQQNTQLPPNQHQSMPNDLFNQQANPINEASDNWDDCFSRRKPPATKYEFIY